jgi:hypothetical protein
MRDTVPILCQRRLPHAWLSVRLLGRVYERCVRCGAVRPFRGNGGYQGSQGSQGGRQTVGN